MNYKKARGYLSQDEREYLFGIAKEASTIINVGIEYGASIHCFVEGSEPNTKIIAIDLIGADKFEGELDCAYEVESEYNIATHYYNETDLINVIFDTHNKKTVLFIKGNSNTIPIEQTADVIFIDGCHHGKCIQNDIDKYSQLAGCKSAVTRKPLGPKYFAAVQFFRSSNTDLSR